MRKMHVHCICKAPGSGYFKNFEIFNFLKFTLDHLLTLIQSALLSPCWRRSDVVLLSGSRRKRRPRFNLLRLLFMERLSIGERFIFGSQSSVIFLRSIMPWSWSRLRPIPVRRSNPFRRSLPFLLSAIWFCKDSRCLLAFSSVSSSVGLCIYGAPRIREV